MPHFHGNHEGSGHHRHRSLLRAEEHREMVLRLQQEDMSDHHAMRRELRYDPESHPQTSHSCLERNTLSPSVHFIVYATTVDQARRDGFPLHRPRIISF